MPTRIFAGIGDHPCFLTLYHYDPHRLQNYRKCASERSRKQINIFAKGHRKKQTKPKLHLLQWHQPLIHYTKGSR